MLIRKEDVGKFICCMAVIVTIIFLVFSGCGTGKKFVILSIINENENENENASNTENVKKVKNIDTFKTIEARMNLGLIGSENYIIPSNSYTEWSGYPFIFEKRDDNYYELKVPSTTGNLSIPAAWVHVKPIRNIYDGTFKNWIYLHSESNLVYDMSKIKGGRFSCYVGLANPWYIEEFVACGHNGSVEIIFQINGSTIYNTGIIKGIDQKEPIHIDFDIPLRAELLTIKVLDGNDGSGCDHWTMGDAQIISYRIEQKN